MASDDKITHSIICEHTQFFSARLYGMSLQGTQENGVPDFLRGETGKTTRPFTRRGVIGPRRDSKDISLTILGFCISRIREINRFSSPKNTPVRPCELFLPVFYSYNSAKNEDSR